MKRFLRALIIASSVPLAIGCDDYRLRVFGAVQPSPVPARPAPETTFANWRADATVVGVFGGRGCGWGTTPGETRPGVQWRITIAPAAILLEEDMANWPTDHLPFSGVLSGQDFNAFYTNNGNYLGSTCQFRDGKLTGRFSQDFSTFEAMETLTWGPPNAETRVQRRWIGSRF